MNHNMDNRIMAKTNRTYFVVNCKKEEKRQLKKLAEIKGFDTLASYMRHLVRMEIKENEIHK